MNLKPQDIYILLKLVVLGESQWSYASVAGDLFMSASEIRLMNFFIVTNH